MVSIILDSSKKLMTVIGLLFFVLVVFLIIKTTAFITEDISSYTKIGTITFPSSEQHHEYVFKAPSNSNYVLELHRKDETAYIPEYIMQKCKDKYPIIPFDFEALKNGGVFDSESAKNRRARVDRETKKQACTRKYFTGIVNWSMHNKNGVKSSQGFLPNTYSHGRPSNKLRSKFYYGLGIIKEIKKGDQVIINLDIPKQHYEKKNVTEYIIYMKRVN